MSAYCGSELVSYMSQVKKELVGFDLQATYDAYVNGTLIPQAETFIDTYCGGRDGTLRRFNSNKGTWEQDGYGKSVLFVPTKYTPLMGTPSVTIDGASASSSAVKAHDTFIQLDGATFAKGEKNVYVVGTHGYNNVPSDIQYVTAQLCANALLDMARRNTAEDVASAGPGRLDFNTMFGNPAIYGSPTIFTTDMKRLLNEYRVRWVDLG